MRGLHSYVDVRASGLAADDLAPDFDWLVNREIETKPKVDEKCIGGTQIFWASKRAVDIGSSLIALPFVAMVAMVIAILNPLFNPGRLLRSEEHTSELQSLMRISYDVFCLKKKKRLNTLSS